MPHDIRRAALKGIVPDRSRDCLPPADRTKTEPCDKCGGVMVGRIDKSNMHQGWMRWYWWCACGNVKDGGVWHPETEEELVYRRWKESQPK